MARHFNALFQFSYCRLSVILPLTDARPHAAPANTAWPATLTPCQAKYFACERTRRHASDSAEKLSGAIASAQVNLNPRQIDAALFAFQSPLAKGAILADEVGLGKTIGAGLVLSRRWAERRRILVITPSNLRKQWYQELTEKFFLPICSCQFARAKADSVAATSWNLVVIDEARRLRNVYKTGNVIANTLKLALGRAQKLRLLFA